MRVFGLCRDQRSGPIVIERDVLVARNVHILDHQHRYDRLGTPVHLQGMSCPRPVRIGEGSWIGANVVILPGVTVGQHAVVGANSVVRADVPTGAVVAGAPARVISTSSERETLNRVRPPRMALGARCGRIVCAGQVVRGRRVDGTGGQPWAQLSISAASV